MYGCKVTGYKLDYSVYNQFSEIWQITPKRNLNHDYTKNITSLKFLYVIRRMTEIFFHF